MLSRDIGVRFIAPLLLCGVGIAVVGTLWRGRLERGAEQITDFTSIIAGAHLLGTAGLYEVNTNMKLQQRLVGEQDTARVFPRWPYVGLALRPLARLQYATAFRIWQAIILACFAGFVLVFPLGTWQERALAISWSIPAVDALAQGQDSPFLLVVLSLALLLWRLDFPMLAGVMIALCASKYHIFVLIPILIIRQRQWRFLAGGVCGGLLLIGVSTLVQGPGWLAAHIANIRRPEIDSYPGIMPNFRGVLGENLGLELILGFVLAAWIGYIMPKLSFEPGLGLVVAGGLLVSHHAYLHDSLLLIPAYLAIASAFPSLRYFVYTLLSPVTAISFYLLPWANVLLVASVVAMIGAVAMQTRKATGEG